MAVLKGEGRVPILFGSYALPLPPNRSAYIARPDAAGAHPTVVIVHDDSGITPGIRAIARHLARHGYSVIVPDLGQASEDGFEWVVSDVADAVASARNPGTDWASGSRVAVFGIGAGGIAASIVAIDEDAAALLLAGGSIDADLLAGYRGALTVLRGSDDELAPPDEVRQVQAAIGFGEWFLYSGVGAGFIDESSPGFVGPAATDAMTRIIAALDRRVGVVPAS